MIGLRLSKELQRISSRRRLFADGSLCQHLLNKLKQVAGQPIKHQRRGKRVEKNKEEPESAITLVGEMKTFITAYDNDRYNSNDLSGLFSVYLDLNVEYKKDKLFEKQAKQAKNRRAFLRPSASVPSRKYCDDGHKPWKQIEIASKKRQRYS